MRNYLSVNELCMLQNESCISALKRGNISSDAGGLLVQQAERITGIIPQFARCFTDYGDINNFLSRYVKIFASFALFGYAVKSL